MIKKLLKGLGKLTPSFLHKLDDKLIVNHPLIWSLKIHYIIYHNLLSLTIFTLFIYALPISASNAYIIVYISVVPIVLSTFSLGLWLYAQNQYNIQKSHGIRSRFYNIKHTLLSFSAILIFTVTAFSPLWMASHRAYEYIVGEKILNIIKSEESTHYYDARIKQLDFLKSLPLSKEIIEDVDKSKQFEDSRREDLEKLKQAYHSAKNEKESAAILNELGKKQVLWENTVTLLNSHNQFFRALYDSNLIEDKSNLRRSDMTSATGVTIKYSGKTYTQYSLSRDSYNYTSRLFYLDESENPYFIDNLICRFFVERLLNLTFGDRINNLDALLEGKVLLNSQEIKRFTATYDSLISPPMLYQIVADIDDMKISLLVILSCLFPAILSIMLVTTTANLFGSKSFFLDTTSTVAFVLFVFTVALVLDSTFRVDGDIILATLSISVFFLAVAVNLILRKSIKRRKASTFLWQASSLSLPISLFFTYLVILDEANLVHINDLVGFGSIVVFSLISLFVFFPLQLRLAHKLYSLPR